MIERCPEVNDKLCQGLLKNELWYMIAKQYSYEIALWKRKNDELLALIEEKEVDILRLKKQLTKTVAKT